MNGVIQKAALLWSVTIGVAGVGAQTMPAPCCSDTCGGACDSCTPAGGHAAVGGHMPLYDRCWPARYTNLAHRAVNRAFTPQVQNGHVLDQTVWNHHFECGTDKLTCGGMAHLQYLSRRRPKPDCTIYLATAMDVDYDPACPDRYCGARQELDTLRVAAVQKYLQGLNCGRCTDFQILVHDPADVSIHTLPVLLMVPQMYGRFRGGLGTVGGVAGPTGTGTR